AAPAGARTSNADAATTVTVTASAATHLGVWEPTGPPRRDTRAGSGRGGHLDDDLGRLDGRHREHPGLEAELVDGLGGHEGHDPMRTGLDLDLRRDLVLHHAGD